MATIFMSARPWCCRATRPALPILRPGRRSSARASFARCFPTPRSSPRPAWLMTRASAAPFFFAAITERGDQRSPAKARDRRAGTMATGTDGGGDAEGIGHLAFGEPELLAMDAGGDEQAVDARGIGTGNIGAQAVADGEDAGTLGDAEQREACRIDRRKGLAVPAHLAAQRLVALRQRAGTERAMALMHDDEIGIGADHRQIARACRLQQRLVIGDRLLPMAGTGIENELGLADIGHAPDADPGEHVVIARRADVIADRAQRPVEGIVAPRQMLPSLLARGMDVVIEVGRDADLGHALCDERGAARRVREDGDALSQIP